jgi:hypothetical protein
MSEQRDLFSKSVVADQAELKANAALYAARERASAAEEEAQPVITAPARVIRQGGAEAARALREKLVAEHRAVVVEAAARFARRESGIPARSILKFRLSDLPRLVRPDRDPPREGGR